MDANKSIFNSTPYKSRFETNVMFKLHRQVSKQNFTITERFLACYFLSPVRRLNGSNFDLCKPLADHNGCACAPKAHTSQSSEAGVKLTFLPLFIDSEVEHRGVVLGMTQLQDKPQLESRSYITEVENETGDLKDAQFDDQVMLYPKWHENCE